MLLVKTVAPRLIEVPFTTSVTRIMPQPSESIERCRGHQSQTGPALPPLGT